MSKATKATTGTTNSGFRATVERELRARSASILATNDDLADSVVLAHDGEDLSGATEAELLDRLATITSW